MNLLCLSDFNQEGVTAKAGEVRWFVPGVALRLVDSWPGCWARIEIPGAAIQVGAVNVAADMDNVTAAIDAPPVDKMIHAPHKAKGKRRG